MNVTQQDEDFDPTKYSSNPDLHFKDIRMEKYRIYFFPPPLPGLPLTELFILEPEAVSFKTPERTWVGGGSHRVVTKEGLSIYVPSGWIGMEWGKDEGKKAYEW